MRSGWTLVLLAGSGLAVPAMAQDAFQVGRTMMGCTDPRAALALASGAAAAAPGGAAVVRQRGGCFPLSPSTRLDVIERNGSVALVRRVPPRVGVPPLYVPVGEVHRAPPAPRPTATAAAKETAGGTGTAAGSGTPAGGAGAGTATREAASGAAAGTSDASSNAGPGSGSTRSGSGMEAGSAGPAANGQAPGAPPPGGETASGAVAPPETGPAPAPPPPPTFGTETPDPGTPAADAPAGGPDADVPPSGVSTSAGSETATGTGAAAGGPAAAAPTSNGSGAGAPTPTAPTSAAPTPTTPAPVTGAGDATANGTASGARATPVGTAEGTSAAAPETVAPAAGGHALLVGLIVLLLMAAFVMGALLVARQRRHFSHVEEDWPPHEALPEATRPVARRAGPSFGPVRAGAPDPAGFRRRCVEALEEAGWTTHVSPGADGGAPDIVGRRDGVLMALRCRPARHEVVSEMVDEAAVMGARQRAQVVVLASNAPFSRKARDEAARQKVHLLRDTELATFMG